MLKKKTKVIFEFTDIDGGYNLKVKLKGDPRDGHIYGIREYINEKIKKAEKIKKDAKNKRG